jgi:hypothetical protein
MMDYYNYSITSLSKIGYLMSMAIYGIMYIIVYFAYREPINYIFFRGIFWLANRTPFIDSNFFAFEKPEDAIIELRYIEKISYIVIPVMIFLNLIYYTSLFSTNIWTDNLIQFFGNRPIERIYILAMILNALSFTLFPFFVVILSRSFRFYLARTFILVAKTKTNKIDKMKYYIQGLKTYNKYLARILNIKLDELKIYSSFLSINGIDEKNLLLSFDDNAKLKPVEWLTDFTNKTDLVIQVTRLQMVKDSIEFALVILPPVFTILALAFPSLAPTLKSLAGQ